MEEVMTWPLLHFIYRRMLWPPPVYVKSHGDGMATSAISEERNHDGMAKSTFYLKGTGRDTLSFLFKRRGEGHLSTFSDEPF